MRSFVKSVTIVLLCFFCLACNAEKKTTPLPTAEGQHGEEAAGKAQETKTTGTTPTPPGIPVTETFDGAPQLSLFPRVASFRPAADDSKGLGFWTTYIDHIQRTSGMRPKSGRDDSNGWTIHGIKGISSVAFFSPLAVKPATRYHVTFDFKGDIPKDASAGIGALEFKEFLWIGEQFTEEMITKYESGAFAGITLKNKRDWQRHSFEFTTSPQARMIHLILHYDGALDREKPVFFDNIAVTEVM